MAGSKLSLLIDEIESGKASLRRQRANHTFSLDALNVKALHSYCQAHGIAASAVIDRMISDFLEELKERESKKKTDGHKKT